MSSFDTFPMLALVVLAIIALAALIYGILSVRRSNAQVRRSETRLQAALTQLETQEKTLAKIRTYQSSLLWNSRDAIACVEYDAPGVSTAWPIDRQIDALYEGRIAECNDAYANLLGHTNRASVVGHSIGEFIPREATDIELTKRFISTGYNLLGWDSRPTRRAPDDTGPVYDVNWTSEIEDSYVVRSWSIFRDITEKLNTITEQILSTERHNSLLLAEEAYFCYEHNPPIDTSLTTDEQSRLLMNGKLIECNKAYARLCSAESPEELLGKSLHEVAIQSVFSSEEHPVTERARLFIDNNYILEKHRTEFVKADGSKLVTILNCRGVLKHGRLTHHWAMMLDLSEIEAKQHDLQSSEARFERMAQQSPALIYRLRLGETPEFEYVNEAILPISGYPHDHELINDIVLHEVFSKQNLELIRSQIEAGRAEPVLTRHLHRSGNAVNLEHRVVAERDSKGHLTHIEGVALDVTDRLIAQRQLQTAFDEIRQLKDELQEENSFLRDAIRSTRSFDAIVGSSPSFRQVVELATQAAPTDSTILILGETGTGKELFARSIHKSSARSNEAMISINCAALPPTLIESELFGHKKGAFTGAETSRIGRFEAAEGGTLFLDEIGELSLDLQSKLLRIVQEGEFERLGDNQTVKVNVRLIAATNSDLAHAVELGTFRADLFYRLNVFPIVIPPLRERVEDIPLLANHFAVKHSHRLGKPFDAISPELLRALVQHTWPGNVRELESAIERSIIISSDGTLQPVELTLSSRIKTPRPVSDLTRSAEVFERSLQEAERDHILRTLEKTNWVIEGADGAATRLGIAPSTLRSKMKKLGVRRPKPDDRRPAEQRRRRFH